MYAMPEGNFIRTGINETQAFCTSEFSDLSPLTDGSVPFALLEGRPSATEFDSKPEFWVIFINFIINFFFYVLHYRDFFRLTNKFEITRSKSFVYHF